MDALQKAFSTNPQSPFIAMRLARFYHNIKDLAQAKITLEKALDMNSNDRRLHYTYAKLLLEMKESSGDLIRYHLQKLFTPSDTNYDAQMLFGRQIFINGDRDKSKAVFYQLGTAKIGTEIREKLYYPIEREFSWTDCKA